MLCDNLEGWDGGVGERFEREGTYTHTYTHTHRHTHTHTHTHTHLWLVHVVWQKPTGHCKAIILQLEKKHMWLTWPW